MDQSGIQEAVEMAVKAVFDHRDRQSNLDRDTHAEHHAWLAQRIAKEADKAAFWNVIQTKTIPWAVLALVGWLATSVYSVIDTYIKDHWK